MTIHRAYIGCLSVTSDKPYIVYGDVRGLVGQHRSLRAARATAKRDHTACASGGGAYSDAIVYRWDDDDGWCIEPPADYKEDT